MSRTKTSQLAPGTVYSIAWPFRQQSLIDGRRVLYARNLWRPGAEVIKEDHGCATICHGVGLLTVTLVSIHKPGPKFHPRVFYVAQFTDPDGKALKPKLRMKTTAAFKTLVKGYRYEYEVYPVKGPWWTEEDQ